MANIVLLIWPLVALGFFAALGRERGLIWATVVGYLFLPEKTAFDLPLLPAYGKLFSLSLGLALGGLVYRERRSWPDMAPPVEDSRGFRLLLIGLFVVFILGAFFTILNNGNALVDGPRVRSGLSMRDLINMVADEIILMMPFFLAWRWLSDERHHREVLLAVMMLGLGYSMLALFEVRMSPRLNVWTYGFFPHDWRQHIRGGGFRPVVFLKHGLWLGIFLFAAVMAAFALFRHTRTANRMLYLLIGFWMVAVLMVSRNLGVVLLMMLFLPCVILLPRGLQVRVVTLVTLLFLAFPAVRQANVLPLDGALNFVSSISPDRAQSLEFRLDNEDAILARSAEKPFFGWGGWGRNRIIDERGRDRTVIDGIWVIYISERGWIGYIGFFGILASGLLFLPRVMRRREVSVATTSLGLIMAANLVYLVPNSALSPIGWLMAGAIAGLVQWRPAEARAPEAEAPEETRGARYTRFAPQARGGRAEAPLRRR